MTETAQPGGETPAPADAVVVTGHDLVQRTPDPTPSAEQAAQPEEQVDTGATEDVAADDAGAEAQPERKPARGFQKRIDELTARIREQERDRDYWREVAMRGAPPPAEKPAAAQPSVQLPPDLAAFVGAPPDPAKYPMGEFDPNYAADLGQHRATMRFAQVEAQRRQVAVQQAQAQFLGNVRQRVEAAASRIDGVTVEAVAAFGETLPAHLGDGLADMIAQSDHGVDVTAYLMGNPQETARIAKMPATAALRELGRIEARIEAQKSSPPPTTKAPDPVPTVRGGGRPPGNPLDVSLPMDQWAENYKKHVIAKRGT